MARKGVKRKPAAIRAAEPVPEQVKDHISSIPEENFEDILLRMDMRDLLLSQRVSKRWQATITASKKIQKKLFFIPCEPGAYCDRKDSLHDRIHRGAGVCYHFNPLLFAEEIPLWWSFVPAYKVVVPLQHSRREWSCFRMYLTAEPMNSARVEFAQDIPDKSSSKKMHEPNYTHLKFTHTWLRSCSLKDIDTIARLHTWNSYSLRNRVTSLPQHIEQQRNITWRIIAYK